MVENSQKGLQNIKSLLIEIWGLYNFDSEIQDVIMNLVTYDINLFIERITSS